MKRACFYLIILLLLPCIGVYASGNSDGRPLIHWKRLFVSYPEPEMNASFSTFALPIKRAGNLIIIEAEVDGVTGNFVLDTGAPYLVLNATYFRDMPVIAGQHSAGVNGEVHESFCTEVATLHLGELQYKRIRADVTDLSPIENSRNIKILGLLGTQLFAKLALTVDLFQNTLYVHKPDKEGIITNTPVITKGKTLTTDFKLLNNVIFIKSAVANNTFWLVFDTGAEATLFDYRRTKKAISQLSIERTAKLTGVGGSSFQIIYAKLDTLIIGGTTFANNPVMLTSLDNMGRAYGQTVDGMLGYDFFSRNVFTINFVRKELTIYGVGL